MSVVEAVGFVSGVIGIIVFLTGRPYLRSWTDPSGPSQGSSGSPAAMLAVVCCLMVISMGAVVSFAIRSIKVPQGVSNHYTIYQPKVATTPRQGTEKSTAGKTTLPASGNARTAPRVAAPTKKQPTKVTSKPSAPVKHIEKSPSVMGQLGTEQSGSRTKNGQSALSGLGEEQTGSGSKGSGSSVLGNLSDDQ